MDHDAAFFLKPGAAMLEALKNVETPCDADACNKLMFTLEADVHEGGWDQDHIMYMVVGDPADPYFVRHHIGVLNHPAIHLQALWDHGMRFTKDVHALAFATETWAHLTFERMTAKHPELIEKLVSAMGDEFPEMTEEERHEQMEKAYYTVADQMLPMPSQMPPELRTEGRNIVLTFRNGTTLGVSRVRDEEPRLLEPLPFSLIEPNHSRVAYFIHQMLNDQRPEIEPGENLWINLLES